MTAKFIDQIRALHKGEVEGGQQLKNPPCNQKLTHGQGIDLSNLK